jgi:hypothetical protein
LSRTTSPKRIVHPVSPVEIIEHSAAVPVTMSQNDAIFAPDFFPELQSPRGVSRTIWIRELPDSAKSIDVELPILFEYCSELKISSPNSIMLFAARQELFTGIFMALDIGADINYVDVPMSSKEADSDYCLIDILNSKYMETFNTEIYAIVRVLIQYFGAKLTGLQHPEIFYLTNYDIIGG